MNNRVSLIGRVVGQPVYYCTEMARDLVRMYLRTDEPGNAEIVHECVAWGTPALHLYDQVKRGDRVVVRGTLRYRTSSRCKGAYVRVQRYARLGAGGEFAAAADAHDHADE